MHALRSAFVAFVPALLAAAALGAQPPDAGAPSFGASVEVEVVEVEVFVRDLHAARGCQALAEMQAVAAARAGDVERESRATLAAIEALLEGLAGRSGRKAGRGVPL